MDGAKLAVVDTLQHGLAGDAEGDGGSPYGYPPGGRVVGDEGADGVGAADPPGRAGGDLLAGDEPVVEPPVEGGGGDAELGCGLVHADPVTGGAGMPRRLRMVAMLAGVNDIPVAVRLRCWLGTLVIIVSS